MAMIRVGKALWAGIHFPQLALEVIERRDGRPLAVIEQQQVYAADHPLLQPGLAIATASALVADLITVARDSDREVQALEALALWAYRITPMVVIGEASTLLLEIGSCQRLHGDLSLLLDQVRLQLKERGHETAIAVAHTPKAAWLLAQNPPPLALIGGVKLDERMLERQLSITAIGQLPLPDKIVSRVLNMGIESLGRLLQFDAALLGKRLGADCIRYLQQLTGHIPDPQTSLTLKPEFEQAIAFVDGIPNRQSLLFPMKRLLQSQSDYLVARQLNCRALQFRFSDAHDIVASIDIELSRPHQRWKSFLDLSLLKLDQIELPELVFGVTLYSQHFLPAGAVSLQLFEEESASDEGHALLDKLASRLGADALQRISTGNSLWPEAATLQVALSDKPEQMIEPAGERPTWLLPAPKPLREHNGALIWKAPLEILRGPERLESPPELGAVKRRDYFIARERGGRVCWIFRELDTQRWFVHGLFA
jgi:protein ImuB